MTAPADALEAELERLRGENAVLRETLDAIDGGVVVYDQGGRYRFGNHLYRQAFPHLPPEDQLVGRRYEDVLAMSIDAGTVHDPQAATDRAGFIARRARELMDRDAPPAQESLDPATGRWSLVRVRFTPTGYRVALRVDITDLKRLQQEVLRAQRMETIGRISGGVAHDFNNLLTVIISNLETLLGRLDDPARLRLAAGALGAAESGARLVRQLLTFARRDVTHPLVLDPGGLLDGMRDLLLRAIGPEITLDLRLDPHAAASCFDATQFEAAVMNLVLNARDAVAGTGGERRIVVATRPGPDGATVEIAVTDTGTGMPQDVAAQAFEPFFTTKEPGAGSGLGLAQVWGFAAGAGGSVAIESGSGGGTTVVIRLPAATSPAAPAEDPPPVPQPQPAQTQPAETQTGCTVLVVEDDEAVLMTSEMILRQLGYEVLTAADPGQALTLLHGPERIDVLFSDISMPGGISGVRLAAEARACRPGIRLLLTSGYPAGALGADAAQAEDIDILPKPYRRDQLRARLQDLLAQPG